MISCRLVSPCKSLGSIIREIEALLKSAVLVTRQSVDYLELRASRSNVCEVVEDMYICYTYQL